MNHLSQLWWGRFGLSKTFWLYNILIPVLIAIPIDVWNKYINVDTKINLSFISLLYFSIFACYSYLALIGLWRSSAKYTGKVLWVWLSRAVVVLGCCIQGLLFFGILLAGYEYVLAYAFFALVFLVLLYKPQIFSKA